tara:strand:- start:2755 stop:3564 length:810 start_codon:yes stop_codon:yes gene_type:complete
MVVEKQEYEVYKENVESLGTVLILPKKYKKEYDTCDNLGKSKSKGPGAARNFAWEHSIQNGFDWHWVMDDNIRGFFRFNKNLEVPVADGTILKCMEDFVLRYENVGMAGPNYDYFVPRRIKFPPYSLNTRIYSCNFIRNDLPFRWRGRYNEDTDLSLRILKNNWCTVQFYAFLQRKQTTQTMKGGNTDEFYAHEGTLPKSKMQVNMHPDVSKLMWRYNRWHHYVNYSGFKQRLKRKSTVEIPKGVNEYGMKFEEKIEDEWKKGELRRYG